jgi:hypothetical protein
MNDEFKEIYDRFKNGEIKGVLYSRAYGGGFSDMDHEEDRQKKISFDQDIVDYIFKNIELIKLDRSWIVDDQLVIEFNVNVNSYNEPDLKKKVQELGYKADILYGTSSLTLSFYPTGTPVRIMSYDSSEDVEVYDPKLYHVL